MNRRLILTGATLVASWLLIGVWVMNAQQIIGHETPLNSNGQVHELYSSTNGELWVSDYFAGEIWRVDPISKTYTVYENLSGASSGQLDDNGTLWWLDFDGNELGRLVPGQNTATLWSLPSNGNLLGLAIDETERIWVANVSESNLYRFNPTVNELCQYSIPLGGGVDYLLSHDDLIWLGDTVLGRLLSFDTTSNTFRVWNLATGSYPQGMAVNGDGHLWWADNGLGVLGRLDASANSIVNFAPPTSSPRPRMLVYTDDLIWYTDDGGMVGGLDPGKALGTATTIVPNESLVQPGCSSVGEGKLVPIRTRSGSLDWEEKSYPSVIHGNGWQIYQLPQGARPWGIAASGTNLWFADQGNSEHREQILSFVHSPTVLPDSFVTFMPAIFGT